MNAETALGAGCYVHLPFCDRICPYCDFAVVRYQRERAQRYLAALRAEIETAPLPREPVDTIFLGGGTPSALDAEDVAALLQLLFERHGIAPGSVECTLEANPSRGSKDLLRWRRAGVTRLSVGVQSLDDADLHRLGRDHSADDAVRFVRDARACGFDNISIDCIAGAPHQSVATFERSIERVLELGPDHVSIYGLTIESGTPYAIWQRREPGAFPDDDAVAQMLESAHDRLERAGFEHYELSNYARPGKRCAHNAGYWHQRDCIAYGMSASGYDAGVRYRNTRSFDAYCAAIEAGASPREESETLDFRSRLGEAAMLALRTAEGIEYDDFRRRFAVDAASVFAEAEKRCSAMGLLETDGRGARLTAKGRLLANTACAEFLQPQVQEPASPVRPKGVAAS